MTTGDKIRLKRQELGLTQKELAIKCGMADSAIRKYESGRIKPKLETTQRIADAMGVSLFDLIDLQPDGEGPEKLEVVRRFTDRIEEEIKNGKQLRWHNGSLCLEYLAIPDHIGSETPSISSGALQLAQDYDRLDAWGQRAVRGLTDFELSRCTEQAHTDTLDEPDKIIRLSLPQYDQPMSAGTGQPADDDMWHDLLLKKRPPRGTSYVARISGHSMEPTYHDGDRLFIRATVDIRPGQVGVFLMDGQQWVKELGDGVLISHNPDYPPRPLTEDVRCQGLVLGVCDDSYLA